VAFDEDFAVDHHVADRGALGGVSLATLSGDATGVPA
jgi:hypothetical protein